jgi:hypothetical protein
MIILSGLPQSWDSVQGSILANHDMADLSISVIMPILQEEWQRHQARRGEHKSSHLARGGMHGAPQRQYWQGNQNNSGYTPQAGPSNYNSSYKPAPKNLVKSQITNQITKILVITRMPLAVKVPMVHVTARIAKIRNRRECYLRNK